MIRNVFRTTLSTREQIGSAWRSFGPMSKALAFVSAILLVWCTLAPAVWGQGRGPRRRDFLDAVIHDAARTFPAHTNLEGERVPRQPMTRQQRAVMEGRVASLGSVDGKVRYGALVRLATGQLDQFRLQYRFVYVVVERDEEDWQKVAAVSVDVDRFGYADMFEPRPFLRLARVEDVDQDGETEVHLVIEGHTAVEPALGTCKSRRSVVVDPGPRPRVVANVASSYECEAPLAHDDQFRGSVRFSDTNGDGHDDLVQRVAPCRAEGMDELVCGRREERIRLWDEGQDRYLAAD